MHGRLSLPLRAVGLPSALEVGVPPVMVALVVLLRLVVTVPVTLASTDLVLELLSLLSSSLLPVSTGGLVVAGGAPVVVGVASSAL